MMTTIEYKGFIAKVKFNEKKGVYTARTQGLSGLWLYCDGATPADLQKNYYHTIDEYIRYTEAALSMNRAA